MANTNNNNWLSALPMVGSIANAIGNIGTARKNRRFTREENQRQRDWATNQWKTQNQASIDFWKMQNAYNDPAAQMQRLKDAGLNPNLVYGSGATTTAGPISTHTAPQPRTSAEKATNAIGGSIFDFLNVRQAQANIARTDAETKAVESRTVGTEFENMVKKSVGVDAYRAKWNKEYNLLSAKERRSTRELGIFLEATDGKTPSGLNPKAAEALKADFDYAIQRAKNAVHTGDILTFQKAIKKFEKELTDKGIAPNSPYYIKGMNTLLDQVFDRANEGVINSGKYNIKDLSGSASGLKPYKIPNYR